jgi:hypothetical protein
MNRRKRHMIVWLALAVAIAAIAPMTAQARLEAADRAGYPAWAAELEAPYWWSKVDTLSDEESGYPAWSRELVAPYWWSAATVVKSPDDRSFPRATLAETTPIVSDDGRSIEFNTYTVSGSILTLLLAIGAGMGLGAWYTRKARLSPA